jgi:Zn-dependent peptidase ImmA (M78 family)
MDYSGLFHVTRNRIHINNSNGLTESRLTILHELQHWIQNKEGFSTGGNEVTVRRFINDQIKNATGDKVKKSIAKFKDLISKNKTNSAK